MSGIMLGKGDQTQDVFFCNTHSTLLFFTKQGKVHAAKAYEIPQRRRGERGRAIVNFLQLEDDQVVTVIPVDEFQDHRFLLIVTREGLVKKTTLDTYSAVRRGGIRAIRLRESDSLVKVLLTSGEDDVIVVTQGGMSIRFSEKDTRSLGRVSTGVKAISLSSGDKVVDAVLVDETGDLLTITTHGYGKRTPFSQYRRIRRGGKGVKNIRLRQGKGMVVAAKRVHEDEEILLLTRKGKSVRVQTHAIPRTGRIASGCRLINVYGRDEVTGIA
jgi:DNA gyrase subunit A